MLSVGSLSTFSSFFFALPSILPIRLERLSPPFHLTLHSFHPLFFRSQIELPQHDFIFSIFSLRCPHFFRLTTPTTAPQQCVTWFYCCCKFYENSVLKALSYFTKCTTAGVKTEPGPGKFRSEFCKRNTNLVMNARIKKTNEKIMANTKHFTVWTQWTVYIKCIRLIVVKCYHLHLLQCISNKFHSFCE